MAFENAGQLKDRFKLLGATRIFCKRLSENDNSKQQIYLGGSFEVLSFFAHGEIVAFPEFKFPNFKAKLDFYWVETDSTEKAQGAQLILYPAYPEVRLSGFLSGCKTAPSKFLQPIRKENRCGTDGRILIFGTTSDGRTLAYLAPEASSIAHELAELFEHEASEGLFLELTLAVGSEQNKAQVLTALKAVYAGGLHPSSRLNKLGESTPYKASNGGGYTLEALLGIIPNGRSEPDYYGWEIKSYSKSRITLMTPEPNGGVYFERGAKEFVKKYGHEVEDGSLYFTGAHKVGALCQSTGMTLRVNGFDIAKQKIIDVGGALRLIDADGQEAATWAFAELLTHWNRKHAFAAYVRYTAQKEQNAYRYETPVIMGEHTEFNLYLGALCSGAIIFDPGTKVTEPNSSRSKVKARSQFRISVNNLNLLYRKLTAESLTD